jgi:hypothetical protein
MPKHLVFTAVEGQKKLPSGTIFDCGWSLLRHGTAVKKRMGDIWVRQTPSIGGILTGHYRTARSIKERTAGCRTASSDHARRGLHPYPDSVFKYFHSRAVGRA